MLGEITIDKAWTYKRYIHWVYRAATHDFVFLKYGRGLGRNDFRGLSKRRAIRQQ